MTMKRTVNRHEALLAYAAVAAALDTTFSIEQLGEMADLSTSLDEVLTATRAMRAVATNADKPDSTRVAQEAMRVLRACAASRRT